MSVYRFKVYFEDDETIVREIEIRSTQTFEDFHKIIQSSILFDGAHPTSFFVSNDSWRRGKEIILLHKSHSAGLKGTWMHETKLAAYIEDPHQKFVYEFDPDGANWILLVELMKIIPEASVTYPRVNKTTGAAPPQYKVTSPAEIPPVEEDEEEEATVIDDAEDTYVHPESAVADHYHPAEDEEEPLIPNMVKTKLAVEIPGEESFADENEDDEMGGGEETEEIDAEEDGEELV
jgi:hypothetical protein